MMRIRTIFLLALWFWSSQPMTPVKAQTNLELNGYLQTENRIRLKDHRFTWNENRLGLKLAGAPSEKYHYFAESRFRGLGFPTVQSLDDLQATDKSRIYRWDWQFIEGYLDWYDFGFKNLDLRLGRQIIAWGTADKMNPTSNLSPDDLEDIFNFGEHLGSNAVKATYYLGNFSFTGVLIPVFTPATLPVGEFGQALLGSVALPAGLTFQEINEHLELPEPQLSQTSQWALKTATSIGKIDFSVSYFQGRDDLPLLTAAVIRPDLTTGALTLDTHLIYPKMQVIGADFASSLGSVGIWGEAALVLPEKIMFRTTTVTPLGRNEQITTALDDQSYLKYVFGGDYTFSTGLYLNFQFLHGFLHERGRANLNDYLTFRVEKKFLNDALKVIPFGAALVISDWKEVSDNYGFVGNPELSYTPADNVELTLGAFILDGKSQTIFSQIKTLDELYLKIKVNF